MSNETLLATGAVLLGAAITPGPNNLLAMQSGRAGPRAVAGLIASVVAGSLVLVTATWFGGAALFARLPALRGVLAIGGAVYLVWLGLGLIRRSPDRPAPASLRSVLALQLVNPKSWIMAIAITSMPPHDALGFATLAGLCVVIPAVCLTIWAAGGALLGRVAWFERAMGGLLVVSACALLVEIA